MYYDGIDRYNEDEIQTIPPYNTPRGSQTYSIKVGTAHKIEKTTCGISKTYLIHGLHAKHATDSFTAWCKAVLADIHSKMDAADLRQETYELSQSPIVQRVKRDTLSSTIDELELKIEVQEGTYQNLLKDMAATADQQTRILRANQAAALAAYIDDWRNELAEKRAEYKALTNEKVTEEISRFEVIVKPLRELIYWLEQGWFVVKPISTDRPICVSYYDNWHGFTTYQTKPRKAKDGT
jgi:hypothetical protein